MHHYSDVFNTLRPRQDGRHFADDIFTCIFFNGNCCILMKFSLKYIRKGPIDNNPALVQIMAGRRSGDKPLSEPMMVRLPIICVTRPQWIKHIPTVISFTHWDDAGHWSPLSSMTRTRLSPAYIHVVSIMAAAGLPTRNVDFGICDKISFEVNEEKIWIMESQNVDFGICDNIFLQKINEKFGTKLMFVENDLI